jgi:hypothetical protein
MVIFDVDEIKDQARHDDLADKGGACCFDYLERR